MPKSEIWQHFTEIDSEKKVTCLYCPQQLSVANKSTCSLIRHLTKKHPDVKIWRQAGSDPHTSQEEILLVNNEDTDANPDSPEATILEYEIDESEVEEGNELQKPAQRTPRFYPVTRITHAKSSLEQNVIAAMTEARKQIGDALVSMKTLTSTNKRQMVEEDEYDYFGQLIATKIRKIQDVDKRETVMHSVYNMIYEALMKNI